MISAPADAAWEPPAVIDEFRLLRPLGRGAMGQVYVGHDTLLDREVAVKFIAALRPDERARQRFLTEARAIARLQHPNVVSIYRVGEFDGRPYLVSELVSGGPLSELPRPAPWQEVLDIAIHAARGLAAAHRQGVLHRDIKPANMMRTADGQVKLLDFGLAKLADGAEPAREDAQVATHVLLSSASTETEPEGVVGTPLYMPPEVRRGGPATCRSDVYSLGCVLFELCAGHPPLILNLAGAAAASVTQSQTFAEGAPVPGAEVDPLGEAPRLAPLCPGIHPGLEEIIHRCLRPDPALRYASAEELWDALSALRSGASRPPAAATGAGVAGAGGNPYRGLLPFEAEHRALFFGRHGETEAVLERLRTGPLVILAGGSGVGKSSLCRAGVLPLVAEGALGGGRPFDVVPLCPGRHPLVALCAALAPLLGQGEEALCALAEAEPAAPARLLRQRTGGRATLLFVDQLEELFTLAPAEEATLFGEVLGHLGDAGAAARALLAVRADHLPRLLSLPGLGREVSRALYLLPPLSAEGVREAVVGPAREAGARFEPEGLVTTLVNAALETDGGLPLLQFALAQLWERRDPSGLVITEQALEALGGVAGALARHADGVLSGLDEAGQAAARRLFRRLIGQRGERLRRTWAELCQDDAAAGAALEELVRGRLISASGGGAETAYEVAHDALLQGWERLRGWLDAGAEGRAARQRVEAAAAEWDRLGRPPEALWHAQQLAEAAQIHQADLRPREAAFLLASRRANERRRLVRWGAALGVPLLVGTLYGGMRLAAQRDLQRAIAARLAGARPVIERARQAHGESERLRQQALLLLDRTPAGPTSADRDAEALWARALAQQAQADDAYADAAYALEAALILDTDRDDVRDLLADVLYNRIHLAETAYRPTDELVRRLVNYDREGERVRRLEAPATLVVRTSPPGARCSLQRYEALEDGPEAQGLRLSAPVAQGDAPTQARLPPGSWLLSLASAGRAPVRLPLLLARGERRELDLHLPEEREVPPGYVYVPPGDFLYGSADDEDVRRGFLNARPQHRLRTGGYLIGRTEVTFGEWIAFLRALPPAERRARLPRGETQGTLRMEELADGAYRLTIRSGTFVYTAAEGEPIRYAHRERRAAQDWRRMPVSGISWQDAHAYLAWLSRAGRVRGARLCDEREWERAARGADGRRFPHGDRLGADDANFAETYGRRPGAFGPDEVGSHERSASPFGVLDMAGNVWELTSGAMNPGQAVFRGGGWYYERTTNRTTNRESVDGAPPRDVIVGLRVCATYSAPSRR